MNHERPSSVDDEQPKKKQKVDPALCYLTLHVKLEGSHAERTLVVGTQESFACLAEGIIQAFSYEITRVYSFHMDGEPFSPAGPTYFAPIANREPSAQDILLAEIHWTEGQEFLLLYDYSECHNFTITVKKIEMSDDVSVISVIHSETKGTPPEQQPDTSDDEFEVHVTDSEGDEDTSSEEVGEDSEDDDFAPKK